ncbi:hypothetical protein BJ138DRAFT_1163251 [Hygrophoropsis aurantiaca]|uniref:Uncharacterized protein n=1 Tax=Hygrophoropsis aurantiaca TaxID=72124 RepID=A0ACB7ZZ11_9AGAM|nr:hypothetical protein BJ138DRAFT_1163251 [Hygrophoropsis aurantiaca]
MSPSCQRKPLHPRHKAPQLPKDRPRRGQAIRCQSACMMVIFRPVDQARQNRVIGVSEEYMHQSIQQAIAKLRDEVNLKNLELERKIEQQNQKIKQQNQKLKQQNQKIEQQNQKIEQQNQTVGELSETYRKRGREMEQQNQAIRELRETDRKQHRKIEGLEAQLGATTAKLTESIGALMPIHLRTHLDDTREYILTQILHLNPRATTWAIFARSPASPQWDTQIARILAGFEREHVPEQFRPSREALRFLFADNREHVYKLCSRDLNRQDSEAKA